jgi:hypothetical protein
MDLGWMQRTHHRQFLLDRSSTDFLNTELWPQHRIYDIYDASQPARTRTIARHPVQEQLSRQQSTIKANSMITNEKSLHCHEIGIVAADTRAPYWSTIR